MKLKYLLLLIPVIFLLVSTDNILAADTNKQLALDSPSVNPNSWLYSFKRLWEKSFYYLSFSNADKLNYSEKLLKERLAELKYVAEKKLLSQIEGSSNRFAYQAGLTTEYLKILNNKDTSNKTLSEFKQYNEILTNLKDLYDFHSSYWRLIQQDIETLDILSRTVNH